jgi:hypothetical protein
MIDPNQQPATKQDLLDLQTQLQAQFQAQLQAQLTAAMDSMREFVRDVETHMLTAFHDWSQINTVRIRKLEADVSNTDAAAGVRLDSLEKRVTNLEKKMGLPPHAQQ